MKWEGLPKSLGIAFAIALLVYAFAYSGIEHLRNRKGPWQVTFSTNSSGTPTLIINQPALAITNVQIVFPDANPGTNALTLLAFAQPQQVPYDLPFGRCIFMDTTFLPGTIVFKVFGHEVQLIPRVLTLDGEEKPWHSHTTFSLPAATNSAASAPLSGR